MDLPEDVFDSLAAPLDRAFDAMELLEAGAIANPDEGRRVGHYWLRAPERAPEAYQRAIELNPKNADAHVNLGRLLQLKGNLRQAKRHYERALKAVSNHQLALYNLGTVFDELDQMEQAAEYYRRAPGVPDAHFNLARIAELNGDELNAQRYMRSYRRLLDGDR